MGLCGSKKPKKPSDSSAKVSCGSFENAISNFEIEGDDAFKTQTKKDLKAIYNTPTGKKLLVSLHKTGKTITIKHTDKGNSFSPKSNTVNYNEKVKKIGNQKWQNRPPAIGLAHELIHAYHAATGTLSPGQADNDNKPNPVKGAKTKPQEKIEELKTAGIAPYDSGITENAVRKEWKPKQPKREWY